jgi:hypothetical protein
LVRAPPGIEGRHLRLVDSELGRIRQDRVLPFVNRYQLGGGLQLLRSSHVKGAGNFLCDIVNPIYTHDLIIGYVQLLGRILPDNSTAL